MIGPLNIKCPACNAMPGEQCAGIVDASKTFAEPHGQRVTAASILSDLDFARVKRERKVEAEQERTVAAITTSTLSVLPDCTPSEQLTGLAIAVIKLADAHGLDRESLIEAFSKVARELPCPSAVLE